MLGGWRSCSTEVRYCTCIGAEDSRGYRFVRVLGNLEVSARQNSSDIWLSQISDPAGGLWPCAELALLSNRRFYVCWRKNQTKKARWCGPFLFGAPARTRTWNPRLRRPVLYPVELRARMIRWPFSSDESACILHEFHSLAMGSACLGGIALIGGVLALGLFVIVMMFVRGSGAAYSGVHT